MSRTNVKTFISAVFGGDRDGAQLRKSLDYYCNSFGQFQNPHEEGTDEHTNWPTTDESAAFAWDRLSDHFLARVSRSIRKEKNAAAQSTIDVDVQAERDGL